MTRQCANARRLRGIVSTLALGCGQAVTFADLAAQLPGFPGTGPVQCPVTLHPKVIGYNDAVEFQRFHFAISFFSLTSSSGVGDGMYTPVVREPAAIGYPFTKWRSAAMSVACLRYPGIPNYFVVERFKSGYVGA